MDISGKVEPVTHTYTHVYFTEPVDIWLLYTYVVVINTDLMNIHM